MAKKGSTAPPARETEAAYVYVGPTVRGVVVSGAIFTGTRETALRGLRDAVAKYPMIADLLVRDTEIAAAKKKIKEGGALAESCRRLRAAAE